LARSHFVKRHGKGLSDGVERFFLGRVEAPDRHEAQAIAAEDPRGDVANGFGCHLEQLGVPLARCRCKP
jgi:hypothetical protein